MSDDGLNSILERLQAEEESLAERVKEKRQKLQLVLCENKQLLAQLHRNMAGVRQCKIEEEVRDVHIALEDLAPQLSEDSRVEAEYKALREFIRYTTDKFKEYASCKATLVEVMAVMERHLKDLSNKSNSLLNQALAAGSDTSGKHVVIYQGERVCETALLCFLVTGNRNPSVARV